MTKAKENKVPLNAKISKENNDWLQQLSSDLGLNNTSATLDLILNLLSSNQSMLGDLMKKKLNTNN